MHVQTDEISRQTHPLEVFSAFPGWLYLFSNHKMNYPAAEQQVISKGNATPQAAGN